MNQDSEINHNQFVSFKIDKETFCVSMSPVQEIIRAPDTVKVPQSQHAMLGLSNLREQVLPIISLRRIFGKDEQEVYDDLTRALVIQCGSRRVGFVVDRVINVFEAQPDHMGTLDDFTSTVSSDLISGIIRTSESSDTDTDLVMVLDFDKIMAQYYNNHGQSLEETNMDDRENHSDDDQDLPEDDVQLVVFRLEEEEFGIEVERVQEIVRVPDSLTRVPKTPGFVEGIINLRGVVLPVINQRKQFGMVNQERNDRQRIIVYVINGVKTGFIVDSVAEVMTLPRDKIQPAPEISTHRDNLINGIVNLHEQKRLIMLIDSEKLLSDDQKTSLEELHG